MGVRKGKGVSRIAAMHTIVLASAMGVLLQATNTRSQEVTPWVSFEYESCLEDLWMADGGDEGDLELISDEYLLFVTLRSGGQLAYQEYAELPLSLISIFNFGACFCAMISSDDQCCVGESANVNLDVTASEMIQDNVYMFCRSVDEAIASILPDTPSPTMAPHTSMPTSSPSSSPSWSPTMAPTVLGSDAPSETPTVEPSGNLPGTPTPTLLPVGSPSPSPTLLPTISPTVSASDAPSSSPTVLPTRSPTVLASDTPSDTPSYIPSDAPSGMPTSPTNRPTAENELCVRFQYGIINDGGFDAAAIMNMENNTLKTGLIIATTNVTIETLNTTFPEAERLLRYRKGLGFRHAFDGGGPQLARPMAEHGLIVPLEFFGSRLPPGFVIEGMGESSEVEGDGGRQLAYVSQRSQSSSLSHRSRRLVFYLDAVPPEIMAIIDNPFCPSETPDVTRCAVVTSSVCVFLEEGDDPAVVRDELLRGIQASIESGEFEEAIPEEHRIP